MKMIVWSPMMSQLSLPMRLWMRLSTSCSKKPLAAEFGLLKPMGLTTFRKISLFSWNCHNQSTSSVWCSVVWTNGWSGYGLPSWPPNGKRLHVPPWRETHTRWLDASSVQKICWWYSCKNAKFEILMLPLCFSLLLMAHIPVSHSQWSFLWMTGFLSSALKSRMEQNLKLESIESQTILACSYIFIVILINVIKTLY